MKEIEAATPIQNAGKSSKALQRTLTMLNYVMMMVGFPSSMLILRLYFVKGGSRKWLSSWLQTVGWPINLVPLLISYHRRRKSMNAAQGSTARTEAYFMTPPLFLAAAAVGIVLGVNTLLYAYGTSYLPVTTSSLLNSTQLVFMAFFAFVLVRQKLTAFSINAVVLLSFGAVVLGINSAADRPQGEGKGMYHLGFVMMMGGAVTYGLMLPLVELSYQKAKVAMSFTAVMEMQMVMTFVATAFSTVGMVVNKDFQAITTEATTFELGEANYYIVLISAAITFQITSLGSVGVIFYGSALLAGIIQATLIPVTEVLAVIFFHESFNGDKGVALGLSLWGFASYFYGEYRVSKMQS